MEIIMKDISFYHMMAVYKTTEWLIIALTSFGIVDKDNELIG